MPTSQRDSLRTSILTYDGHLADFQAILAQQMANLPGAPTAIRLMGCDGPTESRAHAASTELPIAGGAAPYRMALDLLSAVTSVRRELAAWQQRAEARVADDEMFVSPLGGTTLMKEWRALGDIVSTFMRTQSLHQWGAQSGVLRAAERETAAASRWYESLFEALTQALPVTGGPGPEVGASRPILHL